MGVYTQTPQATLNAANTIRDNLGAAVDRIGCQSSLTPDAQLCLIARAYMTAKAQMDKLSTDTTTATDARMRVLNGQVWGVDDIPGDKVSASISLRDATDRAQTLDNIPAAMNLLSQAERSGDELLARAVACQADAFGWDDVAGAYFATRPAKAKQNAELHSLVPSLKNMNATDIFLWVLPAPAGLGATNPYRIQQIADNPTFATLR
jgi:hypothetical protein